MPQFSIIIPVFNRPDELTELLSSLAGQSMRDFEVVVVEDGSTIRSENVTTDFRGQLSVTYIEHANLGPALSRNAGAKMAKGEWLLFLDSDCVAPPDYLQEVANALKNSDIDAFGGPDRAHESFSDVQKAINYSMTSFFTTGGIRGGAKSLEKFHPRSFNMGVSRSAFEAIGGFAAMRFGEDVDFSMRLFEAGYNCALIGSGWVYHKRRVDFGKFFRQVRASGGARIDLSRRHRGSLKMVHMLPAAFTMFVAVSLVGLIFCAYAALPLVLYMLMVGVDATWRNRSVAVGGLAIVASIIQLTGYGLGFYGALWCGGRQNISNKRFYR